MKIIAIATKESELSLDVKAAVQKGRWFHGSRYCVVKTEAQIAVVSMSLLERVLATILRPFVNYETYFINKNFTKLDPERAFPGDLSSSAKTTQFVAQVIQPQPSEVKATETAASKPVIQEVPSGDLSYEGKITQSVAQVIQPQVLKSTTIEAVDPRCRIREYVKRQTAKGDPIDLIVGRGNFPDRSCPKLLSQRELDGVKKNYTPLSIDINSSARPDLVLDITNIDSMACFEDNSVDEIYLERIFPVHGKNWGSASSVKKILEIKKEME